MKRLTIAIHQSFSIMKTEVKKKTTTGGKF